MSTALAPPEPARFASPEEIEAMMIAVADRLEVEVDADRRARLERGRGPLELALADELAQALAR